MTINETVHGRKHSSGRTGIRWLIGIVASIGLTLGSAGDGTAQDRGRDIFKGLLKSLIESQVERDGRRGDLRPNPGQPAPPPPAVLPAPTQEMAQLRQIAGAFHQEAGNLATLFQADARHSYELRHSVADATRFQAAAAAQLQRCGTERDHRRMIEGFRALSADWKTLSHHVQEGGQIGPQTRQCIERMTALDGQFCQLLGIQEPLDVRELTRVASAVEADLRTLADEVYYSREAVPNRNQQVASLRRLQESIHQWIHLVSDGAPQATIISEFRTGAQAWNQIRSGLDGYTNQSIRRAIGRVQDGNRDMHRLLRIPFQVDPAQLMKMAQGIQAELKLLMQTITLEQLLATPNPRALTTAADEVLGCAQNLTDMLADPKQLPAAGQAWFFLDEAWQVFEYHVESISHPDARLHAEHAEQAIEAMRSSLGVIVVYDPKVVAQRAAAIHNLTDQFQASVHKWLARPGKQDRMVETEVDALESSAHEMETLTGTTRNKSAVRTQCDKVIEEWEHLRPLLARCDTEEREQLNRLTEAFIPELVRLRLMLDD